jgi:polysaccharide biosynthesis protein PslH
VNILALVHRVPYPPNKGEKIRAYHELRHLSKRGHTIDLATFADVKEDLAWTPQLSEFCRDVIIVPKDRRFSKVRSVLALPKRRPLSVGYFESARLRSRVDRWLEERRYDVAFCYSSPMAEYVRTEKARASRMARVMDFVDVDSDKWLQYSEHTEQPMKTLYRFEARSLAVYERAIAEEFDASTFVSAAEAEMFKKIAPGARRVVDVPNGVDADYFGATVRKPRAESPVLVFVGQMDYFANVDAVGWFANDVLPLIQEKRRDVELRIVGREPAPEVKKLAEKQGVRVTGAVADVRDHLAEATMMVAPLRIARGIQNKVLEGMAARVPVVVSPQAMEGIDGVDGKHALVRKEARAYAEAVLQLLEDASLRETLAREARELVVGKYAWEPAMSKLESLLVECTGRSGNAGD